MGWLHENEAYTLDVSHLQRAGEYSMPNGEDLTKQIKEAERIYSQRWKAGLRPPPKPWEQPRYGVTGYGQPWPFTPEEEAAIAAYSEYHGGQFPGGFNVRAYIGHSKERPKEPFEPYKRAAEQEYLAKEPKIPFEEWLKEQGIDLAPEPRWKPPAYKREYPEPTYWKPPEPERAFEGLIPRLGIAKRQRTNTSNG